MSFIKGGKYYEWQRKQDILRSVRCIKQEKIEYPKLINNTKAKFLFKVERLISNNVVKGIIMFELDN